MRALVTGSTGFVGGTLMERLLTMPDQKVVAATRDASRRLPSAFERRCIASLAPGADWRSGLAGVDTVYHLAARVHVMHDTVNDPLSAFRQTNVDGTLQLARQTVDAGVRRFVFVSSIKVNGERTQAGQRFRADDPPAPVDPYGVSKLEAEQGLRQLAGETGLEVSLLGHLWCMGRESRRIPADDELAAARGSAAIWSYRQSAQLGRTGQFGRLADRLRAAPRRGGPNLSRERRRGSVDLRPPSAAGPSSAPASTAASCAGALAGGSIGVDGQARFGTTPVRFAAVRHQ